MTGYTINKIQAEMVAAGSHWWDKGTMRWFGCRVSEKVYQGEGGVYFVTSEQPPHGPRQYSVRQYHPPGKYRQVECLECRHMWKVPILFEGGYVKGSENTQNLSGEPSRFCPKCKSKTTMAQPAEDGGGEIDTVGEFCSMSRSQAHTLAAKMAGPSAVVTEEVHREPTEAEQLATDIQRNGGSCNPQWAAKLIRLANKHQRLMVDHCNGLNVYGEDDEPLAPLRNVRAKIEAVAKEARCGVMFSGDPRGSTVKLLLPNEATNSLGGVGWCVPTRD